VQQQEPSYKRRSRFLSAHRRRAHSQYSGTNIGTSRISFCHKVKQYQPSTRDFSQPSTTHSRESQSQRARVSKTRSIRQSSHQLNTYKFLQMLSSTKACTHRRRTETPTSLSRWKKYSSWFQTRTSCLECVRDTKVTPQPPPFSSQVAGDVVTHYPIIANLASGNFIWVNATGYALYVQQFSLAPNGGTPTYQLTINNVPWTISVTGTGQQQETNLTTLSLVNALTFQSTMQDQEVLLNNGYQIQVSLIGGSGSIDIYFLMAQRLPLSSKGAL
jgi:hypothetical protein